MEAVLNWENEGTTLPSGSYTTSSFVENIFSASVENNIINELKIGGDTIYASVSNTFLVYQTDTNSIVFKKALKIDPATDLLVDNAGNNVTIDENNLYVLNEDTHKIIEIDVEDVDTYLIAGTDNIINTSFIITHNIYCFVAGTQITLSDNSTKNIEDIKIGDEVISFNENTNEIESKKVIGLKQPIHNDLVKYYLSNGKTLISTFDHPLYVNNLELVSYNPNLTNERYNLDKVVKQIKVGDVVKLDNKEESKIEGFEILPKINTQTYIITVEDNHNFYANNILVHNK
jgi:intein/homing endonuclease